MGKKPIFDFHLSASINYKFMEKIPDPERTGKGTERLPLQEIWQPHQGPGPPAEWPNPTRTRKARAKGTSLGKINFDLKPEELEAYLDEYVIKQDLAKSILATKVCTHFNRIRHSLEQGRDPEPGVGSIKNNIILIGPTGVGKTYLVKLIAKKIGVPFHQGGRHQVQRNRLRGRRRGRPGAGPGLRRRR